MQCEPAIILYKHFVVPHPNLLMKKKKSTKKSHFRHRISFPPLRPFQLLFLLVVSFLCVGRQDVFTLHTLDRSLKAQFSSFSFLILSLPAKFDATRTTQSSSITISNLSIRVTMSVMSDDSNRKEQRKNGDHDDSSLLSESLHSSSGHSKVSGSTDGSSKKTLPEMLASRETRAVLYSKLSVFAVLVVTATVGASLTYIFASREEVGDFESQFFDFANEIAELSHLSAKNIFGMTASLSATLTSHAVSTNTEWPLFSVPHFETRGSHFRNIAVADFTAISPVVATATRTAWEDYALAHQDWIADGQQFAQQQQQERSIPPKIHGRADLYDDDLLTDQRYHLPVWQTSPAPQLDTDMINFDLLGDYSFRRIFRFILETRQPVVSEVGNVKKLFGTAVPEVGGHPQSLLVQPILQDFEALPNQQEPAVVGVLTTVLSWDRFFTDLLHEGAQGVVVVVKDSCSDSFTYIINGPEAIFVAEGDHHDPQFDHLLVETPFAPFLSITEGTGAASANCVYSLFIYPTAKLQSEFTSRKPILLTCAVVAVFIFTSLVCVIYDVMVQRRQNTVMNAANRSNAIVSSLFPKEVQDRLFKNGEQNLKDLSKKSTKESERDTSAAFHKTTKVSVRLTKFLSLTSYVESHESSNNILGNDGSDELEPPPEAAFAGGPVNFGSKPIADLFPKTTVMFADISGFTAWSSTRSPVDVFTLLETIYHSFDIIAKKRRVFKVETIGDCYVAVCGLPEPRKDHAVVMTRFAKDCMYKFNELTKQLEVSLGPDTGDLAIRVGLHSGPVTAGVLRGDKSRFQLFGDTVNTAARLEQTGERNRVHLSHETAKLVQESGKSHWLTARKELVTAKGKGELQTFWLQAKSFGEESEGGAATSKKALAIENDESAVAAVEVGPSSGSTPAGQSTLTEIRDSPKMQRLIDWNFDVLQRLLKSIIESRNGLILEHDESVCKMEQEIMAQDSNVLDEVAEFVELLPFEKKDQSFKEANSAKLNEETVSLEVAIQLRDYVEMIACQYRQSNFFHSFEHASHVTMSVSKLLSRIVAQEDSNAPSDATHDGTYGIASDPLSQFAIVFSALVHDVDHCGLPNFLLIKENQKLAAKYKNKSVAEQNSTDLAWELLMDPRFKKLRECLYSNTVELVRFRRVMINTVLATDIFDKELGQLRRNRWDKAFKNVDCDQSSPDLLSSPDDTMRRATIVIEHLIQASDVAHTMQHFEIFKKWNERLFHEMVTAYKEGRSETDPSSGWYQSELGFFDCYVIPLAKKLKECGVFGVSSDEYLNYALENRREWSSRGEEIVERMVSKYCTASSAEESSSPSNEA